MNYVINLSWFMFRTIRLSDFALVSLSFCSRTAVGFPERAANQRSKSRRLYRPYRVQVHADDEQPRVFQQLEHCASGQIRTDKTFNIRIIWSKGSLKVTANRYRRYYDFTTATFSVQLDIVREKNSFSHIGANFCQDLIHLWRFTVFRRSQRRL